MEYSRLEDLDRLIVVLGISAHARPISSAEVFELCLEEIVRLRNKVKILESSIDE